MSGTAQAFLDYGEQRAARPRRTPELFNGGVKAPTPLEAKLQERSRLTRSYKAWKRSERRRLIEAEPRLLGLISYVRRMTLEDGDELLEAVATCEWLRSAPQEIKLLALRIIQDRVDRLKLLSGLPNFSDPVPPETSVWIECRKLLEAGARL